MSPVIRRFLVGFFAGYHNVPRSTTVVEMRILVGQLGCTFTFYVQIGWMPIQAEYYSKNKVSLEACLRFTASHKSKTWRNGSGLFSQSILIMVSTFHMCWCSNSRDQNKFPSRSTPPTYGQRPHSRMQVRPLRSSQICCKQNPAENEQDRKAFETLQVLYPLSKSVR